MPAISPAARTAVSRDPTYAGRMPDDDDATQEERALRALANIHAGADITDEAMRLSNDYTDRRTRRVKAWFARIARRG